MSYGLKQENLVKVNTQSKVKKSQVALIDAQHLKTGGDLFWSGDYVYSFQCYNGDSNPLRGLHSGL